MLNHVDCFLRLKKLSIKSPLICFEKMVLVCADITVCEGIFNWLTGCMKCFSKSTALEYKLSDIYIYPVECQLKSIAKKYAFVFPKQNIQYEHSADVVQKFNDTLSILVNVHYLSSGYLWLLM